MVKIPTEVREVFESQGIFAVGSVGKNQIVNVSPRIFFEIKEETIYWLDFFHHKSYQNFKSNPWVTVAVFDKHHLTGFQLRGMVNFVTDELKKEKIRKSIVERTLKENKSEKVKHMTERQAELILFEPKVVYSLNPENFSDLSIGSDIDSKKIL